eukprot:1625530-Amphidinium_carterae.1
MSRTLLPLRRADSTPDRVEGTPHSLSERSDRNPGMVRGGNSTRRPGKGGDDDGDDDGDDKNDGFPIGGGNRGNQPFDGWKEENDAWARNRGRISVAASPGGVDPGRDPSRILAKFDLLSDSLKKNAKDPPRDTQGTEEAVVEGMMKMTTEEETILQNLIVHEADMCRKCESTETE